MALLCTGTAGGAHPRPWCHPDTEDNLPWNLGGGNRVPPGRCSTGRLAIQRTSPRIESFDGLASEGLLARSVGSLVPVPCAAPSSGAREARRLVRNDGYVNRRSRRGRGDGEVVGSDMGPYPKRPSA